MNISSLVAAAWEQALRESPNPLDTDVFGPRRTYRERLDLLPRNVYGELIPRIVTVRGNIRRLGKPRRAPRLPA